MNKTLRLGKSGIEYLDYVWNFYSGCHHKRMGICSVDKCWARSITERFPGHYPNGFEPTFYPEAFLSPLYLKKPSVIGCAFMGDLFGDWVDPMGLVRVDPEGRIKEPLKVAIYRTIRLCPQHRFLFLTKQPQNLPQWSPFPDNCWVGVTATNDSMIYSAMAVFRKIEAKIKYLSIEPFLSWDGHSKYAFERNTDRRWLDWAIIGSQTRPYKPPKIEWVEEIVRACDKSGIPVFLKENLKPLLEDDPLNPLFWVNIHNDERGHERQDDELRQELPQ